MKRQEKEMVAVLEALKSDHGVTHVKVAMEAEGILLGEILRTKIITMAAGIGLSIKIGGCEAITDTRIAAEHETDILLAPMIESQFALEKFLYMANYQFDEEDLIDSDVERLGKSKKYRPGTVCIMDDYLLVAFSKFDNQNKAYLTMPEYLGFLINFWDNVNRVYSQKDVSVPIFGSGITRIKEHKNISDESLLKIMLWTFRISEMRFKYPAKLSIIIHEDKIDSINLLDIKEAENGL